MDSKVGGWRTRTASPYLDAEKRPSGFGQGDLVRLQHVAFDLEQRRLNGIPTGAEQDLGAGREALRATHMTVGTHDHDRFVLGVQPQTPGTQQRQRSTPLLHVIHSSNVSPCCGTEHFHAFRLAIRARNASEALASP